MLAIFSFFLFLGVFSPHRTRQLLGCRGWLERPFYKPLGMLLVFGWGVAVVPTALSADNERIEPVYQAPGFWNGDWHYGTNGYNYGPPDAGSSEGKCGNKPKDRPEHYWLPPERRWEDVDLEQDRDNHGMHYTPYAQLQVTRALKGEGYDLPVGYYQVKLGHYSSGSAKRHLSEEQQAEQLARFPVPSPLKRPSPTKAEALKRSVPAVLVVYKLGEVKAVFPVQQVLPNDEPVKQQRGPFAKLPLPLPTPQKNKARPQAKLLAVGQQWALEFAEGKTLYRSLL